MLKKRDNGLLNTYTFISKLRGRMHECIQEKVNFFINMIERQMRENKGKTNNKNKQVCLLLESVGSSLEHKGRGEKKKAGVRGKRMFLFFFFSKNFFPNMK